MTEVKFIKASGGHSIGDTLNTSQGAASFLVEAGIAEAAKAPEKPAPKANQSRGKTPQGGSSPADGASTAG